MRIRFTKMQGAGNDFVVLDETQARHNFSSAQYRFLADRHFGVGADQILTVRPAPNTPRSTLNMSFTTPMAVRWSTAAMVRAVLCAMCATKA